MVHEIQEVTSLEMVVVSLMPPILRSYDTPIKSCEKGESLASGHDAAR